ncbi:MAG TPA: hypothetical protein VK826_08570 [Bacteroidia bacterium]|nr:hypothetical protein [Bacteroidia bacterium]
MKHFLFFFFFACATVLSAQDSVHVTNAYKNGEKNEDYFRNKDGNKHGKYIRYTRYGKVYIDGQYRNGTPVGTWQYYSADTSGVLVQTLDYDTHKELFCDSMRAQGLICGPRYFGGNMQQQEYIQLRIKTDFTEAERARLKGTTVLAVFAIDPATFKTYGVSVDDPALSEDLRQKIVRIVTEMPAWLPPTCKSQSMVWRMSAPFVFQ